MQWYTDWKFWAFVIGLLNSLMIGYTFIVLKFNDFKHVQDAQKQILEVLTNLNTCYSSLDKKLAVQTAVCNERHSRSTKRIVGKTGKKKIKRKCKVLKKS